jgi:hypothetical protein
MEKPALGIDRKRRRLLIMERAEADEVAACAAQTHVRADNLDDIGARADFLDFVVAEASHQPPITLSLYHCPQPLGIIRHDTVNSAFD